MLDGTMHIDCANCETPMKMVDSTGGWAEYECEYCKARVVYFSSMLPSKKATTPKIVLVKLIELETLIADAEVHNDTPYYQSLVKLIGEMFEVV